MLLDLNLPDMSGTQIPDDHCLMVWQRDVTPPAACSTSTTMQGCVGWWSGSAAASAGPWRSAARPTRAWRGRAGSLARARGEEFDAVVLDHYMPERDGLELLPELLAIAGGPPVIFVTAAEEPRIVR